MSVIDDDLRGDTADLVCNGCLESVCWTIGVILPGVPDKYRAIASTSREHVSGPGLKLNLLNRRCVSGQGPYRLLSFDINDMTSLVARCCSKQRVVFGELEVHNSIVVRFQYQERLNKVAGTLIRRIHEADVTIFIPNRYQWIGVAAGGTERERACMRLTGRRRAAVDIDICR